MSENNRDRDTVRETDRTTIITDGGRDRGGSGGIIAAVVLLLVALVVGYLFLGGGLNRAADKTGVNVNVAAPNVRLPDVNVKVPDKIEVPNVKVESTSNSSK